MRFAYWLMAQLSQSEVEQTGLPTEDFTQTDIQNALKLFFGIAGAVATIFITLGGLKYIMSQGNPQEATKAKDSIVNALIGLVIVVTSYGIISFVVKIVMG